MISVSAAFEASIESDHIPDRVLRRFKVGAVDYSSLVLNWGVLRRDIHDPWSGSLTLALRSEEGSLTSGWLSTRTLRQSATIELGLDLGTGAEYALLFTGTVESIVPSHSKRTTKVKLISNFAVAHTKILTGSLSGNLITLITVILENELGFAYPANFDTSSFTELETWGGEAGLHGHVSATANETVARALSQIADITDTYITLTPDGKIGFGRFSGSSAASAVAYGNADYLDASSSLKVDTILNSVSICWALSIAKVDCLPETVTDSASIATYGLRETNLNYSGAFLGRRAGALYVASRIIAERKDPILYHTLRMPLKAALLEPGDDIDLTIAGYSATPDTLFKVTRTTLDLQELQVTLKGRYARRWDIWTLGSTALAELNSGNRLE